MFDPQALLALLATLPVHLDGVCCRSGRVPLADYPGGRPFTLVAVSGRGEVGFGEHVAFRASEQRAFVRAIGSMFTAKAGPLDSILRPQIPAFARAALEGALIDLGLRQARLSLAALTGAAAAPRLRWVRSFAARADAGAHARTLEGGLKVDVFVGWSEAEIAALPRERVIILDFKERGDPKLCAHLEGALPDAIFEDPPTGARPARIGRDRSLLSEADVAAAVGRGEAVNLKAPRLGGYRALLRALAVARERRGRVYFGGMFEVGPGREQARQLAALFCPEAPNDLGPLDGAASPLQGPSPSPIRLDSVGFGATRPWMDLAIWSTTSGAVRPAGRP